mmetsp:Transcript_35991/g.113878  ORF Transcript_35991/g.113878 Transcript_35991/m.113878 type:complete len:323 (-) Transcript_35991:1561-2529(-)
MSCATWCSPVAYARGAAFPRASVPCSKASRVARAPLPAVVIPLLRGLRGRCAAAAGGGRRADVEVLEVGLDLVDPSGASRRGDKRKVRVWLPPGNRKEGAPPGGWPVLFLQDGQNVFDDEESFSGCSWGAIETAEALISSGKAPPFVVVAIDHAEDLRSYDLLPYLDAVVEEVMPMVQEAYNVSSNPARVAFGGSSFGGISTLCACMRHPGVFGSALVESPSLWFSEGSFLKDLAAYEGPWPEHVFVGMGSTEYSGPEEVDALHVAGATKCAEILGGQGLGPNRLRLEIAEGHVHSERCWGERLPGALEFLLEGWNDPLPPA